MAGEEGEGAEMVASVMDWEAGIPAAAIADVAAALAAAELEEEGGAAVGAGGGYWGRRINKRYNIRMNILL